MGCCKDSSEQDSPDFEPPTPPVTMGSLAQPCDVLTGNKSSFQMRTATIWTITMDMYVTDTDVTEVNASSRSVSSNVLLDE